MVREKDDKELQKSNPPQEVNASFPYNRDLEHIQGNAFLGEQVSVTRNVQSGQPLTREEMERH